MNTQQPRPVFWQSRIGGRVLLLLAVLLLAGCQGSRAKPSVMILAAMSTREAVEEVARQFTSETGIEVKVNPGSSNALASQILAGAPGDVFLSANEKWADAIEEQGLVLKRETRLKNRLVLVVPRGNPAGVKTPRDLLSDKVSRVALAGDKVPAGIYAEQALRFLKLYQPLAEGKKLVRGLDVRVTMSYVERNEAEAGLVYATDARISTGVDAVYTFETTMHSPIVYPLLLLKDSEGKESAQKFHDFLGSDAAKVIFEKHGFTFAENP